MTTMRVVGECFFWYRLTRVFPDKFHRAVKRLCVCVFIVMSPLIPVAATSKGAFMSLISSHFIWPHLIDLILSELSALWSSPVWRGCNQSDKIAWPTLFFWHTGSLSNTLGSGEMRSDERQSDEIRWDEWYECCYLFQTATVSCHDGGCYI